MKVVTKYQADDWKLFDTEEQCLAHEADRANLAAANELLDGGASLYEALARFHVAHSWWTNGLTADQIALLQRTTKNTAFIVSHWQCCDEPVYKPICIDLDGSVRLWGRGGWSGCYGNFVSLADLFRYAARTEEMAARKRAAA